MEASDGKIWLWNEIRYGNERAFYRLYMESYDNMLRYGLNQGRDRAKVMECINELFAEIWSKKENLPKVEKVSGYLFIIFKRKISRLVSRKQPVFSLPEEGLIAVSAEDSSYEEILIASQAEEEKKLRIRNALNKLTPRQKELIRMKYYEAMTMEEISERLNISLRTIYNTLHSAVALLRKELANTR